MSAAKGLAELFYFISFLKIFLTEFRALNFCLSTSGSTVNVLITNKLQVAWLLFFIVIEKILF